MKALLFAMVVVAFVCLDAVRSQRCFSCTGMLCLRMRNCPEGKNVCFTQFAQRNKYEFEMTKGCAEKCPKTNLPVKVSCCKTDGCNFFLNDE